jgi:GR25 family glycosyltransferase involved in LPS biosynthesis
MLYFFLFLFIAPFALQAKLEDHFKPALNKTYPKKMRGIDFIYMINLDERPEKFLKSKAQLDFFGIIPYRFSAVNGWRLSLDTINDVGVVYTEDMQGGEYATSFLPEDEGKLYHSPVSEIGKTYFAHRISRGVIGILLSHLSILQDAYDSGYETIWVMEDDISVQYNPHILSNYIEELDGIVGKNKWDILFTDKDTKDATGHYTPCLCYAWRPNFTPENPSRFGSKTRIGSFFKIEGRYGAYSMIIRRSGMKKLLDFFKKYNLYLPYDIDFYAVPNIQLYTVVEDVVSTDPRALTDNAAPNFLNKK